MPFASAGLRFLAKSPFLKPIVSGVRWPKGRGQVSLWSIFISVTLVTAGGALEVQGSREGWGVKRGVGGLVPECTGVFLIPPRSGDSLAVFHVLHIPSFPWLLFLGACPAQSARPYLQASLCTWNSGPEHVLLRTRFHKPTGGCRWRPWTAGQSWRTDPLTSKCAVPSVLRSSCKAPASSPVLGGDFLTCDKSHHSKDTTCRVPEV